MSDAEAGAKPGTLNDWIRAQMPPDAHPLEVRSPLADNVKELHAPKNIVIFSDGTAQEGGVGSNTNVYKLFTMCEDRTPRQTLFYDRGLGTGVWHKWIGSITGSGITQNILDCYKFISDNYQLGDSIFLFGFSRGATTVRSLAGFIHRFGILPYCRPELAKRAYAIYRNPNIGTKDKEADAFLKRNCTTYCNIKFLGTWETVAALGFPVPWVDGVLNWVPFFRHRFHELVVNPIVENCYHAMAIDERRKVFELLPWQTKEQGEEATGLVPIEYSVADAKEELLWDSGSYGYVRSKGRQIVNQVWFSGVHTDVGGGYKEHGLSDISLAWMIDKAEACGLRWNFDNPYAPSVQKYFGDRDNMRQDCEDKLHDSRAGWLKRLIFRGESRGLMWGRWTPGEKGTISSEEKKKRKEAAEDYVAKYGKPIIHASVSKRVDQSKKDAKGTQDKGYNPWIFDLFPCKDADYDEEEWTNQYDSYGTNFRAAYRARFASGAEVPDVVGKTQAEATTAITLVLGTTRDCEPKGEVKRAAVLEVGTVRHKESDTVAVGNVISQHPSAKMRVNLGSKVSLVISTGKGASGASERGALQRPAPEGPPDSQGPAERASFE